MSKTPNKRSNTKYPALDPHLNLRTRKEYIDCDYFDELPENWTDPKTGKTINTKQYLNDFYNEHLHADFSGKKRIHPKVKKAADSNKILKDLEENISLQIKEIGKYISNLKVKNKTKIKLRKVLTQFKKELKKVIKKEQYFYDDFYKTESYTRNNNRNACVLSRAKASSKVLGFDDLPESLIEQNNVEDQLIEQIDRKREESE